MSTPLYNIPGSTQTAAPAQQAAATPVSSSSARFRLMWLRCSVNHSRP